MASALFTNYTRNLTIGRHNFSLDTLKVMLVSSVPSEANLDSWVARSDATNEVTGTGYTAGGIAQAYTLNAVDTTNNRETITLTNITSGWTATTVTYSGAIYYKDSGSAATDYLIGFVDFGTSTPVTNGTIDITYTSDLILTK